MKFNLKTIIPLLSCFAIVLACLVLPVKVSADAVDKSVVNLMPATSYRYTENGVAKGEAVKPFRFFQSVDSASWRWDTALHDTAFVGFVLTIQVQRGIVPSNVHMIPYVGANPVILSQAGVVGDYVQYTYDSSVNLSFTEIVANWTDPYTGRFNIVSFYGVRGDIGSVNSASYRVSRFYGPDNMPVIQTQINQASLPISRGYQSGDGSSSYFDRVDVSFRKSQVNYRYLDSASILILTHSPAANITAYVAEDRAVSQWSSAVIYKSLSVTVSESFTSTNQDDDGSLYTWYAYVATVDLTGVDLNDKMVNFTFDSYPISDGVSFWSVKYIAFKLPVEDIPWYQTFYQWIKNLFNSGTDALIDALGSGNDSLVNGTPDQQQQVAAGKDNLESGASDLEQLTQDMQVTKPTVNAGDFSADVVLSASGMQLMGTPFTVLWQSPTLVTVIVALVSIILISFVFFGKKG